MVPREIIVTHKPCGIRNNFLWMYSSLSVVCNLGIVPSNWLY